MNPDPNQPQMPPAETPAPQVPPTPAPEPAQPVVVQPETPAAAPVAFAAAPVVDPSPAPAPTVAPAPAAPNPFGAAPVSSQPAAAPQFAQPTTIGSSPAAPANPAKGFLADPKRKKLIILLAAVVGGLIVLGVIALIVVQLLFPSKADYRQAVSQFNDVTSAYSDLSSDATKLQFDVDGSTTDTQYTNDSDSVTKSLQAFQDENKKLAAQKAVKTGDGKKLYATYEGKVNSFATYATDLLTSLKSFRPAIKACSDASSTATLLDECVSALNKVGDVPNTDLKQFLTVLQTQYKALQGLETQLAAITDPYGKQYTQYSALRDQVYDIQDKISSAASDYSSNADKHADDIDPAPAANALGDFLVKKANK